MPLSQLESDTIAKACAVAKTLLLDLQPKLAGFSAIYDAEGGAKGTITQEELDEVAALSGLTKAQLDSALYAMTTTILPAITNAYASLAQLAARFL
jgi:hypothetical protein